MLLAPALHVQGTEETVHYAMILLDGKKIGHQTLAEKIGASVEQTLRIELSLGKGKATVLQRTVETPAR